MHPSRHRGLLDVFRCDLRPVAQGVAVQGPCEPPGSDGASQIPTASFSMQISAKSSHADQFQGKRRTDSLRTTAAFTAGWDAVDIDPTIPISFSTIPNLSWQVHQRSWATLRTQCAITSARPNLHVETEGVQVTGLIESGQLRVQCLQERVGDVATLEWVWGRPNNHNQIVVLRGGALE